MIYSVTSLATKLQRGLEWRLSKHPAKQRKHTLS